MSASEPLAKFAESHGLTYSDRADLPKQGSKEPWKLRQNYAVDLRALRYGSLEDGAMTFARRVRAAEPIAA